MGGRLAVGVSHVVVQEERDPVGAGGSPGAAATLGGSEGRSGVGCSTSTAKEYPGEAGRFNNVTGLRGKAQLPLPSLSSAPCQV